VLPCASPRAAFGNFREENPDLKSLMLVTLFLLCDALGISAADVVLRVEQARKRKPRR